MWAIQILQMFNRKVHPEYVPVAPESDNHLNEEYKSSNQDEMLSEYITLYPTTGIFKSSANCAKSHTPHSSCRMNDSDGNRECWIKSDEECKYTNINYLFFESNLRHIINY